MNVTLLDLKTGVTRDCSDWSKNCEPSVFWWTEGSGSCDCNRAMAFDREGEDHGEEQRLALGLEDGICLGERRFLIVDVSGNLEGMTKEEILLEANKGYQVDAVLLMRALFLLGMSNHSLG